MSHDIFISYSRRDLAAVKPVKEELDRLGFSCWMDLDGIESGAENFAKKIVPALDSCSVVLFFVSVPSQRSEWTAKELGYAERHGKRIVPVRTNDDPLVGEFDLNYGNSNIVDWRCPEQKEVLFRDLRRWTAGPSAGAPASAAVADGARAEERELGERGGGERNPGRGCSVTLAVSFMAVALLGGGLVLFSGSRIARSFQVAGEATGGKTAATSVSQAEMADSAVRSDRLETIRGGSFDSDFAESSSSSRAGGTRQREERVIAKETSDNRDFPSMSIVRGLEPQLSPSRTSGPSVGTIAMFSVAAATVAVAAFAFSRILRRRSAKR